MKINLSESNKKILDKYRIDYKSYIDREITREEYELSFIDSIDELIVSYRDEEGEPLKEWLELEKVRDEIYITNWKDLTK